MPTYEYICTECDDKFEVFQKMSEAPLKKCKKCDGKLRKIFSPGGGVIFKGSGFYVNDYKQVNSAKTQSAEPSKNNCKPGECGKSCKAS